ncbi:MAG: tRNA 2-thiouridine(34) synthase MnmA [Clostridia bacterium]|nr:tRNA 2-thiouridine(34) synthase MnmA [Clostridia bacterium]
MKKRVLLGMSGGVDSSVSAILLQKEGYEVIGCTMRLWELGDNGEESACCGSQAIQEAKRVCAQLGIPHYTINCKKEFKEKVVDNFIKEYKEARTPNPCVECNRYLKFGHFYQKAKELECDAIATGHYASIEFSDKYQQYVLEKSKEERKDQTYFLYTIPREILEHIMFPLKNYSDKKEIRKIAEENGLLVAQKKDSQEICFVPDNNYQGFLRKYGNYKNEKGKIVLQDGKVLGEHQGLIYYTIGQRKGLGIAYQEPLYVLKLNKEKNEVIVGTEKELYQKELKARELNWMVFDKLEEPLKCKAKIRYRSKEADCIVYPEEGNKVKVKFDTEQRAITPGQSVVFYNEDDVVLGGGKIYF